MTAPRALRAGTRIKELADGRLAVYDELAQQGHLLGPLSATVYRLADGRLDLPALTAAVTRTHPDADTATVRLAVTELTATGLLTGGDPSG